MKPTKRYPFGPDYRVHPGATLAEVAVQRLAEQIGVDAGSLVAIADGLDPITQDVADKLATLNHGLSAGFWMSLQRNYDDARIYGASDPL